MRVRDNKKGVICKQLESDIQSIDFSTMAIVMNQSLTPTKLDSTNPATPSNYPDKRSYVAAYKRMVQMVLESPSDRAKLQKALKEFHDTYIVEDLIENLKDLLNAPKCRQLYHAIRPLVPSRLRQEYNSLLPHVPTNERKVVNIKQIGGGGFGFSIRGGKEFGCGIFVSGVLPSSKAAQNGLKPGDELVRVNGLTLSQATHEEVVNLIKLKKTLLLTCKSVGMIPDQSPTTGEITWMTVVSDQKKKHHSSSSRLAHQGPILKCARRVQVNMDGSGILGASIKTSSESQAGVHIVEITPNSVAHNAGLKVGDEILDVNGQSLINVSHQDTIKMLKSSDTLMLTVRVEESFHRDQLHPFSNPPADFELKPNDFDVDAEMLATDSTNRQSDTTGFVLRVKEDPNAAEREKRAQEVERNKNVARLSLLDMEIEQDKGGAHMASSVAWGYGPALAMPTLMGMMGGQEVGTDPGQDEGQESNLLWPANEGEKKRDSNAMPQSLVTVFQHNRTQENQSQQNIPSPISLLYSPTIPMPHVPLLTSSPPPILPKHVRPKSPPPPPKLPSPPEDKKELVRPELASYQFPVDDDEQTTIKNKPNLMKQPSVSALKKSNNDPNAKPKKRTPAFRERVEIINVEDDDQRRGLDNVADDVHPSNMEFSEAVLQGRRVDFHTIPKDAPLKIAIRGGIDTPLGGQIIVSRIIEGGAAEKYRHLNLGDQILVCDGVSLLDVTHDEAAEALKKAMDMESNSIDLVVAVNPDYDQGEDPIDSPQTMWPPKMEDTVLEEPVSGTKHDYARSARRAHSGFTLRGKENPHASQAHAFLPTPKGQQ